MIKKKLRIVYLIFLFCFFLFINAYSKVEIKVFVNDEIITNIDIKKEAEYLKILNPNLTQIEEKKILDLSKNSLINEIIKKNEILRLNKIEEKKNEFLEDYLKNLYSRLNFKNENEFKNVLSLKNTYSIDEVKKKLNIELFWNELIYKK